MFGFGKSSVSTGVDAVESLLTRGVEAVYPSPDFLRAKLLSGRRLTVYLGIDPTAPTLHLGHAIALRKLRAFQDLGHKIVLLIGDFTGMIGDPTDKAAARVRLSASEVKQNAKRYKEQASKLISFSGANPAVLKRNSAWLSKLTFAELVELAAHFTVDQLLKRDMFDRRVSEGKPVYLHEFFYPLMQGYDSVAMEVDGEIGGNDQTFNMLAGRTLEKQVLGKEKFVISLKLLTDPSGKKMGKTEGNMITLSDSAGDMVGKVMRFTDEMVLPAFELCTERSAEGIAEVRKRLAQGENPRDSKLELAEEIASLYHGPEAARRAVRAFTAAFSEGGLPEDVPQLVLPEGSTLLEVVASVAGSKSEARRLIVAGAVEDASGHVLTESTSLIEDGSVLRIGKKRFVRVHIS